MKRFTIFLLSCLTACIILTGCGEKLKLNQKQLEMTVGDSVELSAGKATKVSWDSSNDDVVTVNSGVVNAKSAGEAVITASSENGETDSCHVKVSDKLISEITLSATGVRVEVGKTIQLEATYKPADASHVVLNWSSSDASIPSMKKGSSPVSLRGLPRSPAKAITISRHPVPSTSAVPDSLPWRRPNRPRSSDRQKRLPLRKAPTLPRAVSRLLPAACCSPILPPVI